MPLTDEQRRFAEHPTGSFVTACPGAGKTRAVVARVARLTRGLPPRRGLAVLSFTNCAIEEFIARCHKAGIGSVLRHPGFVGTFDAFLRRFFFNPGGLDGVAGRPTVVDSWETLGVEIRLRPPHRFAGSGVSLDRFDAATNVIDPASIGHAALRAHVQQHLTLYQNAAGARRQRLARAGYVSVADVRAEVLRRLAAPAWSNALGRALAARFQEVIVDEAQDCNPSDCEVIGWLRSQGIAVSVVADPDQAIYGFRFSTPADLRSLADAFDARDRLTLTSNFRSSPAVCHVAATLRQTEQVDVAVGETAGIAEPVHLLAYAGSRVSESVGRRFCELIEGAGIPGDRAIVLAHARQTALRSCGRGADEDGGEAKVAQMARAVSAFWSTTTSGRGRDAALRTAERMILEMTGQIEPGELPSRAAERRGIDTRWLRRCSLLLVSQLPRHCPATEAGRNAWVEVLRQSVVHLGLRHAAGKSANQYFRNMTGATWHRCLDVEETPRIKSATVHDAKGKEYDGVCFVMPPDRGQLRRTQTLLINWRERNEHEAKRVLYVGLTRARKLAAIAFPNESTAEIQAILAPIADRTQVHHL